MIASKYLLLQAGIFVIMFKSGENGCQRLPYIRNTDQLHLKKS